MPASARVLLLFGGVFDPPHRAHIELPRRIRDRLLGRRAWLVYVPAARSPHKPGGPEASDADRVAMLRLATRRLARCGIWTDEIDRSGPSYWIDTLRRAIRAAPPGSQVRFLIGSDQAAAFHRWREFREILTLTQPVVLLRSPHTSEAALLRAMRATGAWSKAELEQWGSWVADTELMDSSSTQVRGALRAGSDSARTLLPVAVRGYIREHGLYGQGRRRAAAT